MAGEVLAEVYARLAEALALKAVDFVSGLAAFLVVIIFLALGWLVSKVLTWLARHFLDEFKVEAELKKHGIDDSLWGFTFTDVAVVFIHLLTLSAFLGMAADIVNLNFLSDLVLWFIGYVPLLLQGLVVLVLALMAGDYVTDRIKKSKVVPFANFVGVFIEIFIVYTAIVIALPLVLPNADVEILRFTYYIVLGAFAVALALGLGIALGLGLKDTVSDIAEDKKKDIEKLV
jgi:hypothetical protein